jgi:hypothetical protein
LAASGDAKELAGMLFSKQKVRKTRKRASDSAKHHRQPSDLPDDKKRLNQFRKVNYFTSTTIL